MRKLTLDEALEKLDIKYIYANGNAIAIVSRDFNEKKNSRKTKLK